VSVHFGNDDGAKVGAFFESAGLGFRRLTYTRYRACPNSRYGGGGHTDASIQNQDSHVWLDGFADLHHFFEKFTFLFMPPGRVHNDDFESLLLELCDALRGNCDGVRFGVGAEVCYFRLGGRLPGLVEGTSTESIGTDDARLEAAFLIVNSELRACRGFAVPLEGARYE
jgi:hypothetical protein